MWYLTRLKIGILSQQRKFILPYLGKQTNVKYSASFLLQS